MLAVGACGRKGMDVMVKESCFVDLFLFMGQSNMAGRGIVNEEWPEKAPRVIKGAGYEYRAVSDPDVLHHLEEPFGCHENREGGIHDGVMKTGSMVSAFVNAYYEKTGVPVVGVSASKGGSRILEWQPDTPYLNDTRERLKQARDFLRTHGYKIRHTFMLWCQGESDGDDQMTAKEYQAHFMRMWDVMKADGTECCFLVRIGNYNGTEDRNYGEIIQAQDELPEVCKDVVMVSRCFAGMRERGLMKDGFHYYQKAYNEAGKEAGENASEYVNKFF